MNLDQYKAQISSLLTKLPEEEFVPTVRYLCRTDLYFLLRHGLNRKDLEKDWLFQRCKDVQKEPNGCLDLWARGHGKSSIITFGKTIQDVLASHGEDPLPEWKGLEVTICIFSHNRPMAKDFLRWIKRELSDNDKLKSWFPDILYSNPDSESPKWNEDAGLVVKRKSNPKESTIEAFGVVDGQPTGKHYMVRVYDDLVHDKYVSTPDMIHKTTHAMDMSQNLCDQVFNISRYIGTRYDMADTYNDMIKRNMVKVRKFPATHNGKADGKPVLLTQKQLDELKKSPFIFACQQLLDPVATSIKGFKKEWLKYFEYFPGQEEGMNIFITVDPASSKKKNSDYTVFWVIGLAQDNNYYVLDCVRDRLKLSERWDHLLYLHKKWRPKDVGYEKYGMLCDIEYFEEKMARENYRFRIREVGGPVSKEDRIRNLSPLFEQGRIYLKEQILYRDHEDKLRNLIEIFVEEEYINFPMSAGHDDMLDSMARILDQDLAATFPMLDQSMIVTPNGVVQDRYKKRRVVTGKGWGF